MKTFLRKRVLAPLFKDGRLESLLRATRMTTSGSEFTHQAAFPYATFSPWWSDSEFQDIYQKVKKNTLVDVYRLYELWSIVNQVRHIDGDILEVGVWRGGTACLMGRRTGLLGLDNVTVHACDTFEGVVKAGELDSSYRGGEHSDTSIEIVRQLLDLTHVDNVEIHVGIFPEQSASHISATSLRLVHIDVDVYESAREVFEWSWDRLSPGGVVVFDDYGFFDCTGVTRLVSELSDRSDVFFAHNLNGHALFVKT